MYPVLSTKRKGERKGGLFLHETIPGQFSWSVEHTDFCKMLQHRCSDKDIVKFDEL